MLPRGNGKSSLLAALGIWELFFGGEGASVVIVAVDARQAGIIYNIGRRLVELSPELEKRCQIGKEKLYIPARDATFECLPAEPKRLEGLDFSLCLLDEAGVVDRATYEVLTLAQGKREVSTLIAIGTPGPRPHRLRFDRSAQLARRAGRRVRGVAGVQRKRLPASRRGLPPLLASAYPALGDFLAADAMVTLVKTVRENTFRRQRLCQLVNDTVGEFLPAGCWDSLSTGEMIPRRVGEWSSAWTAATVTTPPPW